MDSDDILAICVLFTLLASPVFVLILVFGITALVRTRKWQAEKTQRQNFSVERKPLNPKHEEEFEILDSDDEAEVNDKADAKREEEADFALTWNDKFRKELRRSWSGAAMKEVEREKKQKERDERRKLAREIVKEMRRVELRERRAAQ